MSRSSSVVWLFFVGICFIVFVDESCQQQSLNSDDIRMILTQEKKGDKEQQHDEEVSITTSPSSSLETIRDKRDFYDDYADYDYAESRHLSTKFGHARRSRIKNKHRNKYPHHGATCRSHHGCNQHAGWQQPFGGPHNPGYYPNNFNNNNGGSSAFASAGSANNGGGGSHANAQSATFSLGPYSATFSHAEASAANSRPHLGFFNF